jgi:NhaP-type Na+/H+ and K+/H+ antiporter
MGIRDLGQLPVVSRFAPRRVIGMLGRSDVVRAYSTAVLDSVEAQRGGQVPLRELRDTQLVEVVVRPGSPLAAGRVAEVPLPADSLIVTVQRDRQTLIPRGDTVLQAGDHLTILVREAGVSALHDKLADLEHAIAPGGTRATVETHT